MFTIFFIKTTHRTALYPSFRRQFQMIPISYFFHWNVKKHPRLFSFPSPHPQLSWNSLSWEQWACNCDTNSFITHLYCLSDPKDLKPQIHILVTSYPSAVRQIAWRHFSQVQDHIYSEDWAIGIQVLTSFKMLLLDNGKTVYRHCNLCYIRKTVSWYTRVKFQVIYIQKAVWIHWEPYSFQVIKPLRSCILF